MAGNRGGKKKTTKKSGKSTTAPVAEEHVEELSDGNNSDDMCDPPSEGMKGLKRKRLFTGGGVSSRTRARKAVSNRNEPVREESNPVRGTTVVSLSLDTESEGMSAVSSKSDVAARKFTKTKDKEKVTIVEGSSSNSSLESMLKGVEERIVKAMEEGFSGINLTVETKLEAMNLRMDKLTSIESKGNEDEEYRQWNDFDYGRDHGKDREMAEAEKAETGKKISEKGEEDEENSGKDEEDEKNSEKGEEEKDQEPEKDKENSDSVEKGEEYVEESDEENSLLRLHERVRVQAEEFWRTVDDESEAEKETEKEAEKEAEEEGEKEGEEEAEKEVQEEKEGEEEEEKEAEKEVQEEKEDEKEAEKESEKEVQEEKEAEKEESKGTPTSTEVIIVVVTGIAELAEKEVEVEATQTEQEAIQTEIVEKEAETMRKPRVKVIAVPYGIPRAERLAKMRAEAEKKKARAEKKKAKADGAPKKKGRPKKTEATLKPCTPLPEKRKSEPSRWVQSPFTEGKTDELEVPKKKLKTKT
ncbi:BnaAnng12300D [Brassica napus]|uniref:BnaAnng12300D protein n=1 Tax=Brassica napus TaxID=3708 RepID=A0A078ITJ5_BRANA|nr:BnaAnng12300D [Brassica napus]